ncbi:MAG TPA: hypothetical protein VGK99_07590 [Acidobacteriota bacterium]|jgi:tetratricopeptide (TPR) repeat protein
MDSRRPRIPGWATALLLLLITFLIYQVSLRAPFQFDDRLFLNDPNVRAPGGWLRMSQAGWSRWLPWLTFHWNFRLADENPLWYHAVNLFLHLINVVLVGAVVREWESGRGGEWEIPTLNSGTIAAAIFALHPLQTEAVNYIYQRTVLLAGCFGFAALLLFFRFLEGSRRAIVGVVGLLVLAIMSKESAVGFVPILFMAFAFSRSSGKFRPYLTVLAAAPVLAMLVWMLRSHRYLFTETLVFWRYLALWVYPAGLNIDHDVPVVQGVSLQVALSILALAGLIFLFIALRNRYPALSFWFFAFLFLLIPTSSVIAAPDAMFEHRMYLPMLGLAGMAGNLFLLLLPRFPRIVLPVTVMCLIIWSAVSVLRNRVWLSEVSLWESAAAQSPRKYRPHYNLGTLLLTIDPPRAARSFERALQQQPDSLAAWHNLGQARAFSGNDAGAVVAWDQGLKLYPQSAIMHQALGALYSRKRDFNPAREHLVAAMRLEPRSHATFYELALLFFRFGMLEEALRYGERSLELDDSKAETFLLVSAILRQQGNVEAAEKYRREAERRK